VRVDNNAVYKKLSKLKLSGIVDTLEHRLEAAIKEKWSYSMLLEMLLTDEIERKGHRQLTLRLAKSRLDPQKTLEVYDFAFNKSLIAPIIRELSLCAFIEKKQNIFLLGPSGVGKSHIAQALGHQACRREYDTLFYCSYQLFEWIESGKGDGSYSKRLEQVIKVPLLILDDFGLQALSESQQSTLYRIIAERYEKKSIIITSNLDVSEWPSIFSSTLLGSAALDRLVHRGLQIVIEGASYRTTEFKKTCEKLADHQ
jgi:DNA replication protein DnaC